MSHEAPYPCDTNVGCLSWESLNILWSLAGERLPCGCAEGGDAARLACDRCGTLVCPDLKVNYMSNRVVLTLVCLFALVLVPFAGCTPPASQDVQSVGGSVTDGGSCCPGSTADGIAAAMPGTTAS